MNVIYKQVLQVTDEQKLTLPARAALLDAQFQNGEICIWYAFPIDDTETVETTFYIIGTGNEFPETFSGKYWKTVQADRFVWHVFYKPLTRKRDPIVVETPPGGAE